MTKLSQISGIGPKTLEKLKNLNIETFSDLIYHFPNRYIDFSQTSPIHQAQPDSTITITGTINNFQNIYTKTGKNLQIATVSDQTGQIELIWFNQPYLQNTIKIGQQLSFAGTVSFYRHKKAIFAPFIGRHNTGKIIAVYPETKGLTSNWFRKIIATQIDSLISQQKETLPKNIIKKYKLMDLSTALSQIHLPKSASKLTQARTRLAIDEILSIQVQSFLTKKKWLAQKPTHQLRKQTKISAFIKKLPFKLTPDQKKIWSQLEKELTNSKQITNRLIQGDVGSGKTILAVLACYLASLNHKNSLILAPTQILAQQHYQTFKKLLKNRPIKLITSQSKTNLDQIKNNTILIATHAALHQKQKLTNKIAVLIVDEQHKFGVKQRSFLSKTISPPHLITLSATPIPRTIQATLLGHLDISTIKTMPPGRQPIKTFLVPNQKTTNCYHWLSNHIKSKKQQAYIVCPFIEQSNSLTSVKSATKEYDFLSKKIFPDLKLALIHGKTKPKIKDKIITDFQKNKINILVTTPIIEVGVDIKNATVIVIQSADRFGLAQLHQLRGRVGRGDQTSFCYLFTSSTDPKALSRLKYLQNHKNGLSLAKYDLKTRGPGQIFATLQSGFPSLKLADLSNSKITEFSHQILNQIIADYPDFNLKSMLK